MKLEATIRVPGAVRQMNHDGMPDVDHDDFPDGCVIRGPLEGGDLVIDRVVYGKVLAPGAVESDAHYTDDPWPQARVIAWTELHCVLELPPPPHVPRDLDAELSRLG